MLNEKLPPSLLRFMAIAAGCSIANLYYNQALLDFIGHSANIDIRQIGWVPASTQIGYGLGMLLLIPLGDKLERKRFILIMSALSVLSLVAMASSSSFLTVCLSGFFVGMTTMAPHLIIPFAANLASENSRGKAVGTIISGNLVGMLGARVFAGFLGSALGWRSVYIFAATLLAIVTLVMYKKFPQAKSLYEGSYKKLLGSIVMLLRTQVILREACIVGALIFASFSMFWSTLILLMRSPAFNLGARSVGLFGLLGVGAALLTPKIGQLSDRRDPKSTVGIAIILTLLSFVILVFSSQSLWGLALGVLIMDIGVQAAHVSNQSRIYATVPSARSRLNTAYMFSYFTGGALGSYFGTRAWLIFGWSGVCGLATLCLAAAGIVFLICRLGELNLRYKADLNAL